MKQTLIALVVLVCAVACAQPEKKRECNVPFVPQMCNAVQGPNLAPLTPTGFKVVGVADFNNDHYPDLFLYNENTGESFIWYLRGEPLE